MSAGPRNRAGLVFQPYVEDSARKRGSIFIVAMCSIINGSLPVQEQQHLLLRLAGMPLYPDYAHLDCIKT